MAFHTRGRLSARQIVRGGGRPSWRGNDRSEAQNRHRQAGKFNEEMRCHRHRSEVSTHAPYGRKRKKSNIDDTVERKKVLRSTCPRQERVDFQSDSASLKNRIENENVNVPQTKTPPLPSRLESSIYDIATNLKVYQEKNSNFEKGQRKSRQNIDHEKPDMFKTDTHEYRSLRSEMSPQCTENQFWSKRIDMLTKDIRYSTCQREGDIRTVQKQRQGLHDKHELYKEKKNDSDGRRCKERKAYLYATEKNLQYEAKKNVSCSETTSVQSERRQDYQDHWIEASKEWFAFEREDQHRVQINQTSNNEKYQHVGGRDNNHGWRDHEGRKWDLYEMKRDTCHNGRKEHNLLESRDDHDWRKSDHNDEREEEGRIDTESRLHQNHVKASDFHKGKSSTNLRDDLCEESDNGSQNMHDVKNDDHKKFLDSVNSMDIYKDYANYDGTRKMENVSGAQLERQMDGQYISSYSTSKSSSGNDTSLVHNDLYEHQLSYKRECHENNVCSIQQQTSKPLKSILKKKRDQSSENAAGLGCDENVFHSTLANSTNKCYGDYFPKAFAENELTNLHVQEEHLSIEPSLKKEMNVEDEEEFLYGHQEVKSKQCENQSQIISSPHKYGQRQHSEESDGIRKKVLSSVSNLPSWMEPLSEQKKDEHNRIEGTLDQTVQNILKSIGFNFDLSKRMQELAKLKQQKEEDSQFSINKSASFLGCGISSAELKTELFNTNDSTSSDIKEHSMVEKFSKANQVIMHDEMDTNRWLIQTNKHKDSIHAKGRFEDEASQNKTQPFKKEMIANFEYNTKVDSSLPQWYSSSISPSEVFTPEMETISNFAHSLPKDTNKTSNDLKLKSVPLSNFMKIRHLESSRYDPQSGKRDRQMSPEYSRIVIAPKYKEKQYKNPSKKDKNEAHWQETQKKRERKYEMKTAKVTAHGMQIEESETEFNKSNELSPVSTKDQQLNLKECEERKKKLVLFEKELVRLKKHQNEIMRRRQRQRDGHKDPLLLQNSKLQEEITTQIKLLKKSFDFGNTFQFNADKNAQKVKSTMIKKEKENVEEECSRKQRLFYDPGCHWCCSCVHFSETLYDHLRHLQTRKHKQNDEPVEQHWSSHPEQKSNMVMKSDSEGATSIKGVEFIVSTNAYYCSLCDVFIGDMPSTDAHLTSEGHFSNYEKHIKQNEFYEKRYTLEKAVAISQVKEECETKKESVNGSQRNDVEKQVTETLEEKEIRSAEEESGNTFVNKSKRCGNKHEAVGENIHERDSGNSLLQENAEHSFDSKSENNNIEILENVKAANKEVFGSEFEESKREESSKGKIAIKLTGKTGVKPFFKVLPVWTPVTMKSKMTKSRPFKDTVTQVKTVNKTESENPPNLDQFLSIGGLTTRKLPIYKLKSGIFKKTPCQTTADVTKSEQLESTSPEEAAELKLLGIEADLCPGIASKKKPPPRSQNVSLQKDVSSKSSSSAEQLYSVFFQGVVSSDVATITQNINLDDIPMPAQYVAKKNVAASDMPLSQYLKVTNKYVVSPEMSLSESLKDYNFEKEKIKPSGDLDTEIATGNERLAKIVTDIKSHFMTEDIDKHEAKISEKELKSFDNMNRAKDWDQKNDTCFDADNCQESSQGTIVDDADLCSQVHECQKKHVQQDSGSTLTGTGQDSEKAADISRKRMQAQKVTDSFRLKSEAYPDQMLSVSKETTIDEESLPVDRDFVVVDEYEAN